MTPNFYEDSSNDIVRRIEAKAPLKRLYSQLDLDKQVTTKSIKMSPFEIEQYY